MSIPIELCTKKLKIKKGQEEAALAAINNLFRPEVFQFLFDNKVVCDWDTECANAPKAIPARSYRWVNEKKQFKDLKTAIEDWHFNLVGLEIRDWSGENLADYAALFMALAPYVEDNGQVIIEIEETDEELYFEFYEGQVVETCRHWARGEASKTKFQKVLPLIPEVK